MKHLKIWHYVALLYREGTAWEYKGLLEQKDNKTTPRQIRKRSWTKRLVLSLVSVALAYLSNKGFDKDFVGYAIAALSIFIGLFTNLIIVLYQRHSTIKDPREDMSDLEKLNIKKLRNFIKQFTFVTGKNLLISILVIVLATITLLYEGLMTTELSGFYWVSNLSEINNETVVNFSVCTALFFYRYLLVYLLVDFFVLLLYSIGALFAFLKNEYSNNYL
jgi:hypothetical protein